MAPRCPAGCDGRFLTVDEESGEICLRHWPDVEEVGMGMAQPWTTFCEWKNSLHSIESGRSKEFEPVAVTLSGW